MDVEAKQSLVRESVGEGKSLYQALGDSYARLSKLDFKEKTTYFMVDNNWRFIYFNGSALEIMQQTKSKLLNRSIWEVYPKTSESGLYTKLTQASLDMMEIQFEEYIKALDKWIAFYVYPCSEGLIIYLNDISERIKRDQKLELTQRIINNSPFVVFYIQATENWPVELVTENVLSLTGYAAEEFYDGITFSDIIYHEDVNKVRANYASFLSQKSDPFTLEYRIITKDGTIKWVEEKTLTERNELGEVVAYQSLIYAVTDKKNPKSKQVSIVYYDSFENEPRELNKSEQKAMERDFKKAFKADELSLIYQPTIASSTERMDSVEAMLSWNSSKFGVITQENLNHLAEVVGVKDELDGWMLNQSLQQLSQWQRMGLPYLKLDLNLSLSQFNNENFVKDLKNLLTNASIVPSALQINIPKEALMYNRRFAVTRIKDLKALGVVMSIDFPIEDATLRDLAEYKLDTIKIDKKYMQNIHVAKNKKVMSSVIKQGHKLGLQIVAMGVETKEQVEILKGLKCDKQQGSYFSEPVESDQVTMYFDSYMSSLYKQS